MKIFHASHGSTTSYIKHGLPTSKNKTKVTKACQLSPLNKAFCTSKESLCANFLKVLIICKKHFLKVNDILSYH